MSHARAPFRMSRRLLPLLCLVFVLPGAMLAQVPDSLSFQGYVTNPSGIPLNATVPMIFTLYKNGTNIWQQTHPSVTVSDGRFNVLLGGPGSASLDSVAFNQPIEIGVAIDGKAELTPRTPLVSSAYALGMRGMYTVDVTGALGRGMNVIGGAPHNYVSPTAVGVTISGGGGWSGIVPYPDSVFGDWGTIGGGLNNDAWTWATVSGGVANSARDHGAVIGGGNANTATDNYSTVGGGQLNKASGRFSSVLGGVNNMATGDSAAVAGGGNNTASGEKAFVGGGYSNLASGFGSTVPGGWDNHAIGDYSFAAGRRSRAEHRGSFVWADQSIDINFETSANNQFLIRAFGGVGIGTSSPDNQLSVYGHADISGNLGIGLVSPEAQVHMTKSDGSAKGLKIESTEGDRASFYYSVDKGLVIDSYRPKDARRLDLLMQPNGGNVGIGTLTPGYLLEVDGDAAKPGGGSWTVASDRRLKDIEAPFDRGLDALQTLRPVSYRYKEDNPGGLPSDQTYIGLIAQEVESVIPEAVSRDDAGYLHLNNDPIIWTMLNAINALREQVEHQQLEIEDLRLLLGRSL